MKRNISAPTGALVGKTYVVETDTGLLMMSNPTLYDILACRGIYIEYTCSGVNNRFMAMGKAFDAYAKLAAFCGASPSTATTPEGLALEFIKYSMTFDFAIARMKAPSNGRISGGLLNPAGTLQNVVVQAVYAIPNTLLSGFWQTCEAGAVRRSLCSREDGYLRGCNGNIQFGSESQILLETAYNGPNYKTNIAKISTFANSADLTRNASWAIPTYVAAAAINMTYGQALDKIIGTMDLGDANNKKVSLRAMIVAKLAELGVSEGQKVVQPVVFGGFADSMRILGDAISLTETAAYVPHKGFNSVGSTTVTPISNTSVAYAGAMHPLSDGTLRLPICLMADWRDPVSPPFYGSEYAHTMGVPAAKWSSVTQELGWKIDGQETLSIIGSQPFGVLFNDDCSPKTLPKYDFPLQERLTNVRRYCRATDLADPTIGYTESGSATIEAQQELFVSQVNGADRSISEMASIGDTYAVTLRTLISCSLDGVTSDGSDINLSPAAVDRTLRCYPIGLTTTCVL